MKALEDKLQIGCVKWFHYQYPGVIIFSIPNGGSRNKIEAAKLKRTGTLAGVADLFILKAKVPPPWDCSTGAEAYHGLFIELKAGPKCKQTDLQKAFEVKAKSERYAYHVCHDVDEFMKIVNEYLS